MATKNKSNAKVVYHPQAKTKCLNCGSEYTLGMTMESLNLEICANCHPFYTGQETLVDTAGRIEKFQNRLSKVGTDATKKAKSKKQRKVRTGTIEIQAPSDSIEEAVSAEEPKSEEVVAA